MPGRAAPTERGRTSLLHSVRGDHRGRLGEPVALVDLTTVRAVKASVSSGESGAEPLSTRRTGPRRSSSPGDLHPVGEDRGCDRHDRDRLVLDQVEGALGLEAVDQHQPRALAQHWPSTALSP